MTETAAMLEAHVQFELARWRAETLPATIRAEMDALWGWLEEVRLALLLQPADILGWTQRVVQQAEIPDALLRTLEGCVQAAFRAALEEETHLGELLPRADYDQVVETLIGMQRLRHALTEQITSSPVYSMLVAHVLYQGIKSFTLTENTITRKIPGATSLLRFGQNALNSAAPNLEKGIDKQLIAFINANIHETIGESTRYLNSVMDDRTLWTMAEELWQKNAQRTVASVARTVDENSLVDATDSARRIWASLRQTPLFTHMAEAVVLRFFDMHGEKRVAALLAELGATRDVVEREALALAAPVVRAALEGGYLEQRIRSRLGEFYATYSGTVR